MVRLLQVRQGREMGEGHRRMDSATDSSAVVEDLEANSDEVRCAEEVGMHRGKDLHVGVHSEVLLAHGEQSSPEYDAHQ